MSENGDMSPSVMRLHEHSDGPAFGPLGMPMFAGLSPFMRYGKYVYGVKARIQHVLDSY